MTHQMKIETKILVEISISAKSGHTRKLPENKGEISEAHVLAEPNEWTQMET